MRIPTLLVALSLTAAAQDKLYPFAVAQDYLACAPDSSRLNRPLAPARMRTATAGLPIDFHERACFVSLTGVQLRLQTGPQAT